MQLTPLHAEHYKKEKHPQLSNRWGFCVITYCAKQWSSIITSHLMLWRCHTRGGGAKRCHDEVGQPWGFPGCNGNPLTFNENTLILNSNAEVRREYPTPGCAVGAEGWGARGEGWGGDEGGGWLLRFHKVFLRFRVFCFCFTFLDCMWIRISMESSGCLVFIDAQSRYDKCCK